MLKFLSFLTRVFANFRARLLACDSILLLAFLASGIRHLIHVADFSTVADFSSDSLPLQTFQLCLSTLLALMLLLSIQVLLAADLMAVACVTAVG